MGTEAHGIEIIASSFLFFTALKRRDRINMHFCMRFSLLLGDAVIEIRGERCPLVRKEGQER